MFRCWYNIPRTMMLAGVRTESSSSGEQEEAALATWTETPYGASTLGH